MLLSVAGAGLPSLVISYRNDEGAPLSDDGLYHYGETEWEDLQAAADYALAHGAQSLVLIGYSMGGGIVVSFLYQSALADRVVGVILDAPMLDFEATVDWGARDRFAPWPVKDVGKQIAAWRFDIDWGALDYVESAQKLSVPILLFHGDDDPKVPISTSDELSEARPDLVTYYRTTAAGHVRSWNADPAAYEAAVREFLGRVAPGDQ
jgi:pimeloyl-ACP methyl ester carboxylesterase